MNRISAALCSFSILLLPLFTTANHAAADTNRVLDQAGCS